jgi:hypothetical protein
MLQEQTASVRVSRSFSSLGTHCAHIFRNFKRSCIIVNDRNILVQLLRLSLSSCQLEWTLPPAARLLLWRSQQGDLVGHHLQTSNVLERSSRPCCEQLYATNRPHHREEIFLHEYLCFESFCLQKAHKRTLLFGSAILKHDHHLDC